VEYESRRDADDAYHEMHNKRIGRDDLLKIEVYSAKGHNIRNTKLIREPQWARTPPSASWRFDSGRDRGPGGRRDRSPRRRTPSRDRRERGRGGDFSPRKDDRRERDYDRRDHDRSRSPDDRDRRPIKDDDDRHGDRENGTNGDDRKGSCPAILAFTDIIIKTRISRHRFSASCSR
jgi:hypothetical protein